MMGTYDEMMKAMEDFASAYQWSKKSYQPVFIERLKNRTGLTEYELITNLMQIISKQNQEFNQFREVERQRKVNNHLAYHSKVEKLEAEIHKMRTINMILNSEKCKGRLSVELAKQGIPIAKREDVTADDIMILKLEGLTHEKIADRLGISRATVERRLRERRERIEKGFGQ